MKNVLIVEKCTSGLKIVEGKQNNAENSRYLLGGTFTEFGIKNRNDRIYTADKFLPHLKELMERKNSLGVIYGEFDHPDVFDTSLTRVSHTIESISYTQGSNKVTGEIKLLNTFYGREAKALVDDGCPIFVSSRAAGVTESNGEVTIKKLFTYDAVADPGFSSARMEVKSLNESLGFNEDVNFRVYDISDESKMNEYFSMKTNDYVTRKEMVEYSNYLTDEIEKVQKAIKESVTSGKVEPEKVMRLVENYDGLHDSLKKITEYLDYLAENIQVVVNENSQLKQTTKNLIKHNDYLAEQLEKSIDYSEYVAEQVDKNIDYSNYIAETLDKGIDFSEYIAEHVDKGIKYSEYLAENLDKGIGYTEYIAEHLDKSIAYSEYVAEQVDNSIKYTEYIAEHVDNNIRYAEYIAEHVDNSIKYSEYIAEHLQDNIAYSNYLSETLDKTIEYGKYIAEKLNSNKGFGKLNETFESPEERMGNMKVNNVDQYYDEDEDDDVTDEIDIDEIDTGEDDLEFDIDEEGEDEDGVQPKSQPQVQSRPVQAQAQAQAQSQAQAQPVQAQPVQGEDELKDEGEEILPGMVVKVNDRTAEVLAFNDDNGVAVVKFADTGEVQKVQESRITILGDGRLYESEKTLKNITLQYINEAKKRKASEEKEPHFLLFLSEKRKAAWYNLSQDDKEKVIVAINESNGYTTESDVLRIMEKALSDPKKSLSELLIEAIPADLKPIWESLDVKTQQSVVNSAQFFSLNEKNYENFWRSRGLENYSKNKKLITEEKQSYDNYKLDESVVNRYKNILENLR